MRDFATLFTGRDDVFGTYNVPAGTKRSAKGKLAGTASTKRGTVTQAMYDAHLAGEKRLGIVPIRLDNTVMWIALDADVYNDANLHKQLAKRIAKLGLPLCITRSKSGGAHLWCFFRDPVSAAAARTIGADFVKKLKLDAATEIFPKQETILPSDDGSWINLPYFCGNCVGLAEDGHRELTLEEFLEFADDRLLAHGDMAKRREESDAAVREDEHAEAPPCVQRMYDEGVEEGGRDNALAQIAIYLNRAFPDELEERIADAAKEVMHPPLTLDDVAKVVRQVKRKNYQYLCKQQPMCTLCDKSACLTRKYGVGGGEATKAAVLIDAIKKRDGEEPLYTVTISGRNITVDAEKLMTYRIFRVEAMKVLNRLLPPVEQGNWEAIVNDHLYTMQISEAAPETQNSARIAKQFKDWCEQFVVTSSVKEAMENRAPYWNGQSILFLGDDFLGQIDRQFRISRQQAWRYLSEFGVIQDKVTVEDRKVPVWRYDPEGELWFDVNARGAFE